MVATVLMSMLATLPAHAQGDPAPTTPSLSEKETARELFRTGDEKFRANDFESALRAFKAADDIMHLPTTGIELGRTLLKLGKLLEASDQLRRVTRIPTADNENVTQQQARDEAQRLIDEARGRIPSLQVTVLGVPKQVAVRMTVDDVEVPSSAQGFPQKVNPGAHLIRVTAPGYVAVEERVDLAEGTTDSIDVRMKASAGGASTVDPWGANSQGDAGGDGINGYDLMMYTGFGVGALGVIIGTVTGAITFGNVSDLEDDPACSGTQCDPSKEDDISSANTVATVSTVGFVFGGIGIGVGVTGLILGMYDTGDSDTGDSGDGDQSADALLVSPMVGPGYIGVEGSF